MLVHIRTDAYAWTHIHTNLKMFTTIKRPRQIGKIVTKVKGKTKEVTKEKTKAGRTT